MCFAPGDKIYAIQRNVYRNAQSICECMIVSVVNDYAVVSTDFKENVEKTLYYNITQRICGRNNYLEVYPIRDCYTTKKEAEPVYENNKSLSTFFKWEQIY